MNHPFDMFDGLVNMWAEMEDQDTGRSPWTLRAAHDLCRLDDALSLVDEHLNQLVQSLVMAHADDYVSHPAISDALTIVRQAIYKVAGQMLLADWYQSAIQHAPRPGIEENR